MGLNQELSAAPSTLLLPLPKNRNGDGFLDAEELVEIFRISGESVTDEEIEELMKDGDKNNDGRIDFDEFLKMMEGVQ
nr:troponin C, skeletal muscle-like [Zootoca vivipara]